MLQISISAMVTVIVVTMFSLVYVRYNDILMARACRLYARSRMASDAIMSYVDVSWRLFPFLFVLLGFCSYIISFSLLCGIV